MKRNFNFAVGNRFTDGLVIIISVLLLLVFLREPKPPKISLHQAAKDGNTEAVKHHMAAGVDVNAKNNLGGTPLHEAAASGHKEIVEVLVTKGADVNANIGGWTPLHLAVDEGHTETTDLLRKHGGKTGQELKAEGK